MTTLITGSTGAIGTALAEAYAKQGHHIILHCMHKIQKAEQLARELNERYGVRTLPLQADLSDRKAVQTMTDIAMKEFGFIDVLVNNAGIAQQKLFTDLTDEDWDAMIGINLSGTFYTCRAILPAMIREHRGSILNISSMWGQVGASCEVHYSTAKAGMIGLTKALAKEVAPSGITVNCIAPGVIESPMLSEFSEDDLRALEDETPLGRLGTPEDVASAAVFLTSQNAAFITGQVLGVNGGFVI